MAVDYDTRRRQERDARWALVQRRWKEGRSHREVRLELGWSQSQLSVQMKRMRDAGWVLPYRYSEARRSASKVR